ncbi:HesB/IscA family protein [Legionella sp. W05-934-2]|jgi:iron-sulfur cluster assembly protein|uniref:HesB/IscA family protein n=1 Tax=Legionella sp. W05-934-2 TaxID=1198649 RepID=UPI003462FE54
MSTEVQHVKASKLKGVQLSPAAIKHFLSYLQQQQAAVGVRLYLKKSGCSGLSYQFDYVNEADPDDFVFALSEPYQLFVDKKSYPMLQGCKIDYVREGLNFKLVFDNPNQTGQCGCGESFTVEEQNLG